MTCKGTLRQVFICLRPGTPYPTPLAHCIRVFSILIYTGKGDRGRVESERRGEGQQFTKLGRKYQQDWLSLLSINSDKTLPQGSCIGQFFLDDNILLWCLHSSLVHGKPLFLIVVGPLSVQLVRSRDSLSAGKRFEAKCEVVGARPPPRWAYNLSGGQALKGQ